MSWRLVRMAFDAPLPETITYTSFIEIYRSIDGDVELNVKLENDTVWLSTNQMAMLFDRDEKTIGKHLNNIFSE